MICLRFGKFSIVGILGMMVQLAALKLMYTFAGLNYLAATALAVELAILHNFVWHECFTWRDRARPYFVQRMGRLLRFNLSAGAISLLGNLLLMPLFVEGAHAGVLLSNFAAVCCCSLLTFVAGDRLVYRGADA